MSSIVHHRSWVAMAALLVAAACTQQDSSAPLDPLFNVTPPEGAKVTVCKDASSPAGTYSFTVGQAGGRGGTLLAGTGFTLGAGECVDVWQALPDPPSSDPQVTITVTEVNVPSGVQFDSATSVQAGIQQPTSTNPEVSVTANYYHEASIVYFNSAEPGDFQGCTPGFWKNHTELWPAPYAPSDDFDAAFGVDAFSPDISLLSALKLGGGGLNKLARHGVAALLTSTYGGYPASAADVIAAVAAAVNSGQYEPLATQLDTWNNIGCTVK